jgi:uncharacterized protein (TIGR03382 family)
VEFFESLVKAIQERPTAALLALAVVALAWLFRDSRQRDEKHAADLAAAHQAHLQTALQVAPLAAKMVTCVEVLERLSMRTGA